MANPIELIYSEDLPNNIKSYIKLFYPSDQLAENAAQCIIEENKTLGLDDYCEPHSNQRYEKTGVGWSNNSEWCHGNYILATCLLRWMKTEDTT
tara:strand:+ start:356 stop:637 length:282 start_codon:yes stop_codon:yes gene_type:complete